MSTTETVKWRLKQWVEAALEATEANSFVTVDWTINVAVGKKMPSASIKLNRQEHLLLTYDTALNDDWMMYPFSIRIVDKINWDPYVGEPRAANSQYFTEIVIDYLYSKKQNETEKTSYNIHDIRDIQFRIIRGKRTIRNRKLKTYEITGDLLVKWT